MISFLGVVDEDHDVGQLDGGVAADLHAGRDAGEHGALGGADGGAGALLIAVLLQVQLAQQAQAGLAVGQLALQQEHGVLQFLKAAVGQVLLHGVVDLLDLLVHVVALQLALRQDQAQGGGGVAHIFIDTLPVFGLRGVLVTGHHSPLGQAALSGQENIGRGKSSLAHVGFLHLSLSVISLRYMQSMLLGVTAAQRASASGRGHRPRRQCLSGRIPRSRAGSDPCPSGCHTAGRGQGRRRGRGWRSGSCGRRG